MAHDSPIEVIRQGFSAGNFRAAILDFDGTLSLLRRNWQDVMIPMMVDELVKTGTAESRDDLHNTVEQFVMRLNGRQTIYQMMQLADEVKQRGGQAKEPLDYKHRYHELLWQQVGQRVDAVRNGLLPAETMRVPGAAPLLASLTAAGLTLYLASGTDVNYVRDELEVLGLDSYFGNRIYGALDDYQSFSKAMIIGKIIDDTDVAGHQLLGFGDGFVEIEEVKKVGGTAVGVASDEVARAGINDWKRKRLIEAGADVIIGDYRNLDALLETLGIRRS